jgi:hypothetical protein
MKKIAILAALLTTTACTPARVVGNTAIGAGQVVLGTADMVI